MLQYHACDFMNEHIDVKNMCFSVNSIYFSNFYLLELFKLDLI